MKFRTIRLAGSVDARRRGLFVGAAAFGAALTGLAWRWPGGASTAENVLMSILHDPKSAARVGRKILETKPAVFGRKQLADTLLRRLGVDPARVTELEPHTLGRRVAERIRRDFGDDRTVNVDGWVLSNTEVWLCVLAANCEG